MRLLKLALIAVILGLVGSFYAQHQTNKAPYSPLICERSVNINSGQYYMFYDCYRKHPQKVNHY